MSIATTAHDYNGATMNPAAATKEAMEIGRETGLIPIAEIFYSLQGEGGRAGEATAFVRLAGCNCECWFCDTDFTARASLSVEDIIAQVQDLSPSCRWVCLTGGEPTIHDLAALCTALHARGYRIQVETNGSKPRPQWQIDHITVSPKSRHGVRLDTWYVHNGTEFKYVIDDETDISTALHCAADFGKVTFVQPNSLNPDAQQLCVDAVKAHPGLLRLSLQTHKFLKIL
jgi:organic radical activating enzyme